MQEIYRDPKKKIQIDGKKKNTTQLQVMLTYTMGTCRERAKKFSVHVEPRSIQYEVDASPPYTDFRQMFPFRKRHSCISGAWIIFVLRTIDALCWEKQLFNDKHEC